MSLRFKYKTDMNGDITTILSSASFVITIFKELIIEIQIIDLVISVLTALLELI